MANIILLILSIAIYLSFGLTNAIYILFSTITTFFAAKNLKGKNRKIILITTIVLNVGILLFMKLYLFGQEYITALQDVNILVPVGIAYYTLQVVSYIIDVYKGRIEPQESFFKYLLYVIYIPYLFIGPINRYENISKDLYAKRKIKSENVWNGIIRILWGLLKKFVIAGRISILISTITGDTEIYKGAYALLAMLLYSIQLYSDFSGGIDIVIGASKIIGINLKENFNAPYMAEDVKEFWRRWHISLSTWLKDYVYIPLGGNRCSKIRNKVNLIITFLISGIWHGIHYLLWGLIHGILVAYSKYLKTKWKTLNRIINYIIVSLLWCFFVWPDTILALKMLVSVFTNFNYVDLFSNILNLGLNIPNIIVLVLSVIALAIFDVKKEYFINKIKTSKIEIKTCLICTLVIFILVFGIYGIGFNVSEFIYSKF